MSAYIEKLARALAENIAPSVQSRTTGPNSGETIITFDTPKAVRAILTAMMEPSEGMYAAGHASGFTRYGDEAPDWSSVPEEYRADIREGLGTAFSAMLQAALDET